MEPDTTGGLAGLARQHLRELEADLYTAGIETNQRAIIAALIFGARLMPITDVKKWVERFVREEAAAKAAEQVEADEDSAV